MASGPVRTAALAAALLALCAVATPPSQAAQPSARAVQLTNQLTNTFQRWIDTINRLQTERDLAAVEARLDQILGEKVEIRNGYLRAFRASEAQAGASRLRAANYEDAIAAEKSRVPQKDQEIDALERTIAETKGEIAALKGRRDRVPELEAKLSSMPKTGYMESAPRERLEAELAEARQQVPNPTEIAKSEKDLQQFEAQLQGKRARQPVPDASVLQRLEGQLSRARESAEQYELEARRSQEQLQKYRGTILATAEMVGWLKELIAFRRQALAAPTGIAPRQQVCQTNQGPFRCTGAFDATWSSVCTTDVATQDQGHATVAFTADGWVEARLQSSTPGGSPTTFVGQINAAGQVKGGGSSGDAGEQWQAAFSLVTLAQPTGASKPTGRGTYAYAIRNDKGGFLVQCAGTLLLQ